MWNRSDSSNDDATQLTTATRASTCTAVTALPHPADTETESWEVCLVPTRDGFALLSYANLQIFYFFVHSSCSVLPCNIRRQCPLSTPVSCNFNPLVWGVVKSLITTSLQIYWWACTMENFFSRKFVNSWQEDWLSHMPCASGHYLILLKDELA